MALLKFDSKSLKLELVVGIDESYKPRKDIKTVNNKIEKLRKETTDFLKKTWKDKDVKDLMNHFDKNEKDKKIWTDFLENKYNPKVLKIVKEIKDINNKICPGFEQVITNSTQVENKEKKKNG